MLAELLNQILLELEELAHDGCHPDVVVVYVVRSLVEQVQCVDDADCTADLLHFDVVLLNKVDDLALNVFSTEIDGWLGKLTGC